MHIFQNVKNIIINALQGFDLPEDVSFDAVTAEPPKDPAHGDVATNAAMVFAKQMSMNPRQLAEQIIGKISADDLIDNCEIAGPGFINLRLKKSVWQNEIAKIAKQKGAYGESEIGKGRKVNVEYVSANPTGPMHIGHARGAVYGDSLALLLAKAGFEVTKEYYINDAGKQIETLIDSAFLRYRQALGEKLEIPEGFYPGEYLIPIGQGLKEKYSDSLLSKEKSEWFLEVRQFVLGKMLDLIKNDLKDLGIEHEVFVSEYEIQQAGKIEEGLKLLEGMGLIYQGVLEPPKGQKPDDWEEREQTLFKSTQFGDDLDRPIKKSDGSWTYFASDIAYHLDKYQRGFNEMVIGLGVDHGGYVKRLKAAVSAISGGKAGINVKLHSLVNFLDDGQPVKMSKRAGTFTTVRDVIESVGKDVIRFIMLTRKNDMVLDFDLKKVKEQSKDNPIFYVQYANARACSVLRTAKQEFPEGYKLYEDAMESGDFSFLNEIESEDELALLKIMASWPRILESAAIAHEPHRVAFYLQELASVFHSLWNKGKENEVLRFIVPENSLLTAARLAMIKSLSYVITSALAVMAIEPIEEMR